jgi:hypothetical protein
VFQSQASVAPNRGAVRRALWRDSEDALQWAETADYDNGGRRDGGIGRRARIGPDNGRRGGTGGGGMGGSKEHRGSQEGQKTDAKPTPKVEASLGLAPSDRYLVWSWRYLSCLHLLEQVIAERLGRNNWPQAAHRIANFILRCCSALRCSARLVA